MPKKAAPTEKKETSAQSLIKKYPVLIGLLGFVAGVLVVQLLYSLGVMRMYKWDKKAMQCGKDNCPMMQEKTMMHSMGGSEHRMNMLMGMDAMTADLEQLRGADFDREFLRGMIDHHRGAVLMSELVEERANRRELKELARGIISAQEKEIQQMESWLNE